MLSTIVGALLPIVVTLLLGALAGWRGDVDMRAAKILNRMVLTYALPMLLFASTATTTRAGLAAELPLAGALFAGLVGPFTVALLVCRYILRRDLSASALTAMAFGFPAIPFTGIPILSPLIGDRAVAVVDWGGIIINVVILPVTLICLSIARECEQGDTSASLGPIARRAVMSAFGEPVVWAPAAAILLVLAGVKVPMDVVAALKLLGAAVGGVSLFASGAILQAQGVSFSLPALVSTLGRVLVVPGLALGVLAASGAGTTLQKMVVLALALASAPMQVILSVRFGVYQNENSALLLYSNVLCLPTLACFIDLAGK